MKERLFGSFTLSIVWLNLKEAVAAERGADMAVMWEKWRRKEVGRVVVERNMKVEKEDSDELK